MAGGGAYTKWLVVLLAGVSTAQYYDYIDLEKEDLMMMKIVRAASNQTKGDSLNLPANATSIRENITDSFSCEGLPYGYYADVENDCQIFHVCLPSQTTSGRNTTYKWSFICPQETVFNQEVLVCTRPRDAIDCKDSPMYYDKNMDIGKISNKTNGDEIDNNINQHQQPDQTNNTPQTPNTKPNQKRKQNLVLDGLFREKQTTINNKFDNRKMIAPPNIESDIRKKHSEFDDLNQAPRGTVGANINANMNEEREFEAEKISLERSLKSKPKILKKRGLFRFKADVA